MKSARKSARSLTNSANSNDMEKSTMKSARKSARSLTNSRQIIVTSDAPKASTKAPRSYEREDLTGNFSKSFVASPKSEAASIFYAECMQLLDKVWSELPESGIYDDLFEIASKVNKDTEFDPFKALCSLIDEYDLNARQIRVCLQLISPIITVCCDLTDRLARYLGMSCANRLMGSACNEMQCEKCSDFSQGLPFVRVCYNATRLGFVKEDVDSIDIDALVNCVRYWLDPKEDNEPKSSPKSATKSAPKSATKSATKSAPKSAQIAALQDGIATLQAQLSKILSSK